MLKDLRFIAKDKDQTEKKKTSIRVRRKRKEKDDNKKINSIPVRELKNMTMIEDYQIFRTRGSYKEVD